MTKRCFASGSTKFEANLVTLKIPLKPDPILSISKVSIQIIYFQYIPQKMTKRCFASGSI